MCGGRNCGRHMKRAQNRALPMYAWAGGRVVVSRVGAAVVVVNVKGDGVKMASTADGAC